jgi:hypothetical protein
MNKPPPKALAMIICDDTIEDRVTGKKTLVGLFNNVSAKVCPVRHPEMNIFMVLTEGRGDYQARLKCLKEGGPAVADLSGQIRFPDPMAIVEFNFELLGLVFPSYGVYRFEFYCDDIPVISRKFMLSKSEA